MSVTLVDQEESSAAKDIKNNGERRLRYNQLVGRKIISKEYMEDGTRMQLILHEMEDTDWHIVLEEVSNKKHPLRELQLQWYGSLLDNRELHEPYFIELTKTIEAHTTLVKFTFSTNRISRNNELALVFEALKNNHSIKYLSTSSDDLDLETARVFTGMLTNNQTLLSLDIQFRIFHVKHESGQPDDIYPMVFECFAELTRCLQTTVLERLKINVIDDKGFKVLTQFLPKTLVHLDLADNFISKDSIPIFGSYLNSNGIHLKELILDDRLATEYLEHQASSTVKIIRAGSWEERLSHQDHFLSLNSYELHDADWPLLVTELTKVDTTFREMSLSLSSNFNRNDLNYLGTLLGYQCRLTSLTLINQCLDDPIQTEVIRLLKHNKSINKLHISKMDSEGLSELVNVLHYKNNLTHLNLYSSSFITDEETIMLANSLKTNTFLQSFVLMESQMTDIGFQALLSSLPSSLSQLELDDTLISSKSLPSLLAFIKVHSNLEQISLQKNGISSTSSVDIDVPDLMGQILNITNKKYCIFKLDFNEKVREQIAESLDGYINLSDAHLRHDHILELCTELKKPNQNWSLNLSDNKRISPVGYRHLADILSSTITIVHLSVARNDMNEEARTSLLSGLCNNKTLQKFDINWNKLNNQDIEYIGHFIQNNTTLKELDMSSCNLGDDGAIHLAKFLPGSSLKELNLQYNSLGGRSCASLLSSIPSTLTKLSVGINQIKEPSLPTILTFLATNRTLKILEMQRNPIFGTDYYDRNNNACWQQISEAAKQNSICELA